MRSIASEFYFVLDDWVFPTCAVVLSALAVWLTRKTLKHVGANPRLRILDTLSVPISNLAYLIGLQLFADAAPLPPKPELWLETGIYILGVFFVLQLARKAALLILDWGSLRGNTSNTLQQGFIPLIRNLISLFVFFAGAIMILEHLKYDVMSLLTALGVGSLAVGLAAKDTLSNMISGFTLIIDRNLKPGDRINLAGQIGDVDEIGLRSTRIRTGQGNLLIVPNSELVNTKILNLSVPFRAIPSSVSIRIPIAFPFPDFKKVCELALTDNQKISKTRGSSILLSSLSEGVQSITVAFWVENPDDEGAAQSELNEKLLVLLRKEKIDLAPPMLHS